MPLINPLRGANPDWELLGAKCVEQNKTTDFFFQDDQQIPRDYCNGDDGGFTCPCRSKCLLFGIQNGGGYGTYGGRTEEEIRDLMTKDETEWKPPIPRKESHQPSQRKLRRSRVRP